MPDIRSAAKLNGIPIAGLLGSGATFNLYHAQCSTNMNPTTTEADIPGCTLSVVVPTASSIVLGIACIDEALVTTPGSIYTWFNWNGADSPTIGSGSAYVFTNGRASLAYRGTVGYTYMPAITTSGTFTFKLRASSTIAAATYSIRATHTTLTALVVSN